MINGFDRQGLSRDCRVDSPGENVVWITRSKSAGGWGVSLLSGDGVWKSERLKAWETVHGYLSRRKQLESHRQYILQPCLSGP